MKDIMTRTIKRLQSFGDGLLMFLPCFLAGCGRAVVFRDANEPPMRWIIAGSYYAAFVRRHHLMPAAKAWVRFYDWHPADAIVREIGRQFGKREKFHFSDIDAD